jgi:hypothetical protein
LQVVAVEVLAETIIHQADLVVAVVLVDTEQQQDYL